MTDVDVINISNIKVSTDTHIELVYQAKKKRLHVRDFIKQLLEKEMEKYINKSNATQKQ